MADGRRAHCRNCGGHRNQVGEISWSGLCNPCSHICLDAWNDRMHERDPEVVRRQKIAYVRFALGPRITRALQEAGVFDEGFVAAANLTNPNP